MADEASSPTVIKKKKLPFKPTALRRVAAAAPASTPAKDGENSDAEDNSLDLFRQAKQMKNILAGDRERMLRKKQKQMEEKQRRLSISLGKRRMDDEEEDGDDEVQQGTIPFQSASMAKDQDILDADDFQETPLDEPSSLAGESFSRKLVTPPPSKRSRFSSEQDSRSSKRHHSGASASNDPFRGSPPSRSFRSHTQISTPSKTPRRTTAIPNGTAIISLDSDSEDDIKAFAVEATLRQREDDLEVVGPESLGPTSLGTAPAQPLADVEEEDEFDEYVRKAEEQRARDKAMLQTDAAEGPPKKEAADIMVTSSIPNTKVAYVKYLFDKPLRLVRDSWIALQRRKEVHLPITKDDDVILTWKRKIIYTSSTLLNLGIRPQGDGKIIADEYSKGGLVDGRTKIHLEAWTMEDFQKMEEEEELRQRRDAGEISDEEAPEEEAKETQTWLRVKLKAKDLEVVKLKVVLETTVETLITGFRAQREIPPDKDVGIYFDGERLEEHQTMEEAEIYDLDTLEVHIK